MKTQPLHLAIIEEIMLLLTFIGWGTVIWLAADPAASWWVVAVPQVMSAYVIRLVVESWLKYRGKPLLKLVYENTPSR